MSRYLLCYGIYKKMILKVTKQRAIMISMRIVWVLDVMKVTYELSGPSTKVGAPLADIDSSFPPENFHKNIFLVKSFVWSVLYIYRKLINLPFLIITTSARRRNTKICMGNFDSFRRSRRFKFHAVLVLKIFQP